MRRAKHQRAKKKKKYEYPKHGEETVKKAEAKRDLLFESDALRQFNQVALALGAQPAVRRRGD